MKRYVDIGRRLRQFGQEKFGSMAEFARALNTKPQSLNNYLSGKAKPGNKLEEQLRSLGCDVIWLEHGLGIDEVNNRFEKMKEGILSPDDRSILKLLHELDVFTEAELRLYLNWNELGKNKILRVAEPLQELYGKTKKKGKKDGV